MGPDESIKLGPGVLYIDDEPLGEIKDFTTEETTEAPQSKPKVEIITRGFEELTASLTLLQESWDKFVKVYLLACCPNRKVAHLAKHAKKYRARKKNLNRAIKIVKEAER